MSVAWRARRERGPYGPLLSRVLWLGRVVARFDRGALVLLAHPQDQGVNLSVGHRRGPEKLQQVGAFSLRQCHDPRKLIRTNGTQDTPPGVVAS